MATGLEEAAAYLKKTFPSSTSIVMRDPFRQLAVGLPTSAILGSVTSAVHARSLGR